MRVNKMADVVAVPKRDRNVLPSFFYDNYDHSWKALDHSAQFTKVTGKKWGAVCKSLNFLAKKQGLIDA